jgi:hypothetical protein
MRIGFTGTQVGMNDLQKKALYDALRNFCKDTSFEHQFHHGDCIGADAEAHEIVDKLGISIIIHPPTNPLKRAWCGNFMSRRCVPRGYLDRNHEIVDMTDVLIVAPKSDVEELRSGTWATYRYAKKEGKLIVMLRRIDEI